MLAWLAWLPLFGIIVFVHELGHFLAAKAMGVYAPRFSIGFGPALWRRRHGETEYIVAALPLGGYVRMASRNDEAAAFIEGGTEEGGAEARPADWDENAMIPFGPRPIPENRWFESKRLWQRLVILLAGVTMNLVLGLVVFIALAASLGRTVITSRTVGAVPTPTAAAGMPALQVGDSVLAVEGVRVRHWSDAYARLREARTSLVSITTQRGAVSIDLGEPGSARRSYALGALEPYVPPVLDSVIPGHAAARAGLRSGDSVVAVNGQPVRTFQDFVRNISGSPGRDVGLTVARRGVAAPFAVTVRPDSSEEPDPRTGEPRIVGRVMAMRPTVTASEPLGFGEAVQDGWDRTVETTGTVVRVLRGLVTREVSVRQLGGPIAIGKASAAAARSGLAEFFNLVAFLSVNIAVFNLLPIPILDGGQVLLNVAETMKGRPFSDRTRDAILRVGLLVIAIIFMVALFNDTGLSRVFG